MYKIEVRFKVGKGDSYRSLYEGLGYPSDDGSYYRWGPALSSFGDLIDSFTFKFDTKEDAEAYIEIISQVKPDSLISMRRLY